MKLHDIVYYISYLCRKDRVNIGTQRTFQLTQFMYMLEHTNLCIVTSLYLDD